MQPPCLHRQVTQPCSGASSHCSCHTAPPFLLADARLPVLPNPRLSPRGFFFLFDKAEKHIMLEEKSPNIAAPPTRSRMQSC